VTQTPALIRDETSEPRSESEEDSDEDDEQDETVTVTTVADEATSHAQLSTGKPLISMFGVADYGRPME